MKGQRGQLGTVRFQLELNICTDEEVRIGKARPKDMLVSLANDVDVKIVAIPNSNKMRQ